MKGIANINLRNKVELIKEKVKAGFQMAGWNIMYTCSPRRFKKIFPAQKPIFTGSKRLRILNIVQLLILILVVIYLSVSFSFTSEKQKTQKFNIPENYLAEPANIPAFWLSTVDDVNSFLLNNVHKGKVKTIGISAGGRPIKAVFYGQPRLGKGTSTFSGSLGFGNVRVYRGPDNSKTVYLGMAGVHGGEFEGIVGIINLISVFETGKDLSGREWPDMSIILGKLDRIILIPVMNPDGRARVPLRMELYRGDSKTANTVYEYLNTGGKWDGSDIGWPQVKEFIPLDFSKVGFPGGYPNDAGVNIMHDDFFGHRQPETQALCDLVADEKPDLILNMHTGAPPNDYYIRMHQPFAEPFLLSVFDSLYFHVHSKLAREGLQGSNDPLKETDPSHMPTSVYNLDTVLDLHCGALSVVVEAPCHGFAGTNRNGKTVIQTPEMILRAELIVHQEAMKFILETGGRSRWSQSPKNR